jgi:hypothetical protein
MATLLSDSFTGTNGTALSSHTMDVGSGWTEHTGTWQIQSNKATLTTTGGDNQNCASADAGSADATCQATVVFGGALVSDGLIANCSDAANYYLGLYDLGNSAWMLFEHVAGGYTVRGTSGDSVPTTSVLQLVTAGDQIDLNVGGVNKVSYSTAGRPLKTNTRFGLRTYGGSGATGATFDDFTVSTAGGGATKAPPPFQRRWRYQTRRRVA